MRSTLCGLVSRLNCCSKSGRVRNYMCVRITLTFSMAKLPDLSQFEAEVQYERLLTAKNT